jgi:hypothetical protein
LDANGIAVIVEEPAPGQFFWALRLQRQHGCRAPVERAEHPMPSYGLAMLAGMSALERRLGRPSGLRRSAAGDFGSADFGPTTIAGTL